MIEARQHANEARLKLLETQLEPHMLFNTLANLRALIGVDPVRAQTMLDHMIAYLRATLSASRATGQDGPHTLTDEFARLQDYLELMHSVELNIDTPQEKLGWTKSLTKPGQMLVSVGQGLPVFIYEPEETVPWEVKKILHAKSVARTLVRVRALAKRRA